MQALITGASSGIGLSFARMLSNKGYEIIAVGRNIERLEALKSEIDCQVVVLDISKENNCQVLFDKYPNVDLLINNAGFGGCGEFVSLNLENDLKMIDTNIKALHSLTKLYLDKMVKDNKGSILNVASIAGFLPGPLMSTYYATKAYVLSLSRSIAYELKRSKSNVYLGTLCPGPVKTNFFNMANASHINPKITSDYVVKYAYKKMNKGKVVIIPSFSMKLSRIFSKILPYFLVRRVVYNIQRNRK